VSSKYSSVVLSLHNLVIVAALVAQPVKGGLARAQAEESYFSAEDFCRAVNKDSSVVLQTEVAFLQASCRFILTSLSALIPLFQFQYVQCRIFDLILTFKTVPCPHSIEQGLNFDLVLHSPLWSLRGMLELFDSWRLEERQQVPKHLESLSRDAMERGAQAAKAVLASVSLTDAVLLLSPGTLALGSMRIGYDQVYTVILARPCSTQHLKYKCLLIYT
jgi:hypothetical protein